MCNLHVCLSRRRQRALYGHNLTERGEEINIHLLNFFASAAESQHTYHYDKHGGSTCHGAATVAVAFAVSLGGRIGLSVGELDGPKVCGAFEGDDFLGEYEGEIEGA